VTLLLAWQGVSFVTDAHQGAMILDFEYLGLTCIDVFPLLFIVLSFKDLHMQSGE